MSYLPRCLFGNSFFLRIRDKRIRDSRKETRIRDKRVRDSRKETVERRLLGKRKGTVEE